MIPGFSILYLLFSSWQTLGSLLAKTKEKQQKKSLTSHLQLDEVSLIVPFRNEAPRVHELLKCLKNSSTLPCEIIFINDHSTDNSVDLVNNYLNNKAINYKVFSLSNDKVGKKAAIRLGVKNSSINSKFILTFDADIIFNEYYFENLKQLPESDLFIFPVKMEGKTILEHLYALDYNLLYIINRIAFGFKRPILASGANLLFNKKSFLKWDSFNSHKHLSSGDDMFLLNDFIKGGASIALFSSNNLTVKTSSPSSIKSFLEQRARWISKNKEINDSYSNSLLYLHLIILLLFYTALIKTAVFEEWSYFIALYTLKIFLDLVVISIQKTKVRFSEKLLLPIYTLFQPLYYISLALFPLFKKTKWKGREIKKG